MSANILTISGGYTDGKLKVLRIKTVSLSDITSMLQYDSKLKHSSIVLKPNSAFQRLELEHLLKSNFQMVKLK